MTVERAAIEAIVTEETRALLRSLDRGAEAAAIDAKTRLFDREGILDSLGLVTLLADLELRLEDDFGLSLVLASERAMSRARSPFRSVSTLTEYICEIIDGRG
jgi:hypothetical protein